MSNMLNAIEFNEDLVILNLKAENDHDVLKQMGANLFNLGLVKEFFVDALIQRELEYPTGLPCDPIGLAIPHTDGDHVNTQTISVAILDEPVSFIQMGTDDKYVDVHIVVMLGLKESDKQLEFLQALIGIFTQREKLIELKNIKNKEELVKIFTSYFD